MNQDVNRAQFLKYVKIYIESDPEASAYVSEDDVWTTFQKLGINSF